MLTAHTFTRRFRRPLPSIVVDPQSVVSAFRAAIVEVKAKPVSDQLVVGRAVNDAYAIHAKVYASRAVFQRAPSSVRQRHLAKLAAIEGALRDRSNDPLSSLGYGLIRMWLLALCQDDRAIASEFGNELAQLGARAHGQRVLSAAGA